MTRHAFICDYIRTPIGRYGGALARIRTDDLAAAPIAALRQRYALDWERLDDVILGGANQAGEDNRNVARMALLLAGLPACIPGVTVNRLCGSGMEAVSQAARAIIAGEADLLIAGGVESMSRAPLVMPKPTEAFSRQAEIHDSTLGWRFINPAMRTMWGVDNLPDTAETVAAECGISRQDQDRFAAASQNKAAHAQAAGVLAGEILPITPPGKDAAPVTTDEHPRNTDAAKLATLKPITRPTGTVTAGNATGINDGAAALLIASESAVSRFNLTPLARIVGSAAAGVEPGRMGIGPVPATRKLLARLGRSAADLDLIELNEAFAAQAVACLRGLEIADDDPRVNRWGGAIALGHPLGMTGARLVGTAARQLVAGNLRTALCTMCIGVGQGTAIMLERAR
jgi:acetyl-CoA acyltransferase